MVLRTIRIINRRKKKMNPKLLFTIPKREKIKIRNRNSLNTYISQSQQKLFLIISETVWKYVHTLGMLLFQN